MYTVSLFGIVTMNPTLYSEYILIKIKNQQTNKQKLSPQDKQIQNKIKELGLQ
jgi:hypothetical protein